MSEPRSAGEIARDCVFEDGGIACPQESSQEKACFKEAPCVCCQSAVDRIAKLIQAERTQWQVRYDAMLKEQHDIQNGLVKDIQHYTKVAEDCETLEAEISKLKEEILKLKGSPNAE